MPSTTNKNADNILNNNQTLLSEQKPTHAIVINNKSEKEPLIDREQNSRRLTIMLIMVVIYAFAEIIVGYSQNCLSLVADSFHMLSDGLSLVVALYGINLASRGSHRTWSGFSNTFGWGRAEVISTLVNAVFLSALCITILLDSIERLINPETVKRPFLVLCVGFGGLLINVIGLIMLRGDHGHSHGVDDVGSTSISDEDDENTNLRENHSHNNDISHDSTGHGHSHNDHDNMNMRAVFLHVLGDFLGSIVVILTAGTLCLLGCGHKLSNISGTIYENFTAECISAEENAAINDLADTSVNNQNNSCFDVSNNVLSTKIFGCYSINTLSETIKYSEPSWTLYIDPLCSFTLVCLLIFMTVPLLKGPVSILLQTVPSHIKQENLSKKILKIKNVCSVHCLHLWRFDGKTMIASLHVSVRNMDIWNDTLKQLHEIFKPLGIHSITCQPELFTVDENIFENLNNIDKLPLINLHKLSNSTHRSNGSFKNHSSDENQNSNSFTNLPNCCKPDVNPEQVCCSRTQMFSESLSGLNDIVNQVDNDRNNSRS